MTYVTIYSFIRNKKMWAQEETTGHQQKVCSVKSQKTIVPYGIQAFVVDKQKAEAIGGSTVDATRKLTECEICAGNKK